MLERGIPGVLAAIALFGQVACSPSSSSSAEALQPVEVKTVEGSVRGEIAGDVRAFRGIPYAAPPTGANRWKRPQPVTSWTDVKDATKFGKQCPQPKISGEADPDTDEDCLFVNIWTPARAASAPRPVMVWIHGGAFTLGNGNIEAEKLVRRTQHVIVSLNYRLGVLGFLAHGALAQEDGGRAGNYGLYDQRAALEWVKRNIASFGGDPNDVTIFGESAGGQSVSAHYVSKGSAGLFHRAIVQSGAIAVRGLLATTAQAETMANDLGAAVGCTGADVVACLRGKPANTLVAGLHHTNQPPGGLLQGSAKVAAWLPTLDGTFLEKQPYELLSSGSFARVPLLLGTTASEGGLFHAGLFGDVALKSEADYEPALARTFGTSASTVAARYPASAFKSPNDALAKVDTLAIFTCPTRAQARLVSNAGVPTYVYELRRIPVNGTITALGAVHATDLVFLFDTESVLGGAAGEDARGLVTDMQDYWGRFAATADPNGGASIPWPRYDASDPFLALDVPLSKGNALAKEDCDFFDPIPLVAPKFY